MRYRTLGKTGLQVSEIGLGCASFWGKKIFSERAAIRLVHTAAERGVTFFDTGSSYAHGNAELRLGKALATLPIQRDLIIATKAGTRAHNGKLIKNFSPGWIRQSVEASLKRLGLDSIPLLQLHGPTLPHLSDELFTMLDALRQQGKIRHLGINSFDDAVIERAMQLPLFATVMLDYNILRQQRTPLIAKLYERGISVLAGMALAQGLYDPKRFAQPSLRNLWYALRAYKNHRADMANAARFRFLNQLDDMTAAQAALGWVLHNPHISCAVIGTTRMPHLLDNIAMSGRTLDNALIARIEHT